MPERNVTNDEATRAERLALSIEEAAWRLSVSPSFLRLEIARGRIRPVRLGRRLLIRESEIERYLADHGQAEQKPEVPSSSKEKSDAEE